MSARAGRPFLIFAAAALVVIAGLAVDLVLLVTNFQIGQAALRAAAEAAATAVEPAAGDPAAWELRLTDSPDQPSAYTLADEALGEARARVTLTAVVSDGRQVLVRGVVAAPTVFVRLFGVDAIPFELAATAALRPPAGLP